MHNLVAEAAVRRRDENAPILLRDVGADKTSIVARINLSGGGL